jgi:multidrug efflux pump subunit AcrB
MNSFILWLERKKTCFCVLICLCLVSLCVIFYADGKVNPEGGGSYGITIRHYGTDAADMERNVSMPLEDALSAIPGVRSVYSSSENSLSRVFVRFGGSGRGQYEAIREAAQRVYEGLPASAQRPEIQSSGDSRIPVWSAAVFPEKGNSADTAFFLERMVKTRLESLEGAGEVLISGTGLKEIVITLDQEKLASLGLEPSMAAAALGMNDGLFSGGSFADSGRELIVTVDGRYAPERESDTFSASALGRALIPLDGGRAVELSSVAFIEECERTPDTFSRLNGKKAALISVMAASGADLRKLSRNIRKALAAMPQGWEFTVLADRGAEEAAAFYSVFAAALQGAFMVALTSFILNRKRAHNAVQGPDYAGFFCALAVPAVCLVSTAILAFLRLPPDRIVFAGIAAGIGGAVDPVILCKEKLRRCETACEAASALKPLRGPLAAGAVTTAAALLPLSAPGTGGGVRTIALALAVVTVTAFVLSMTLLPPLLFWRGAAALPEKRGFVLPRRIQKIFRFFSRLLSRFLAGNVRICVRYPSLAAAGAVLFSAAAVLALFIRGVDTGSYGSSNSVYAQVEFDGGLLAAETDRLLAEYGEKLSRCEGFRNVETGARTGSGTLLVSFDPSRLHADQARKLIRDIPIPGGFVFFPETDSNERYWTVKIFGDDDQKCRALAEELARLCAGLPLIREGVLNFKEGSKKLIMLPDRESLAESGIRFSQAAEKARVGVFGPVVYKRIGAKGEIDVRIRTAGAGEIYEAPEHVTRQSMAGERISGLPAAYGGGGSVRLDSVMRNKTGREPASIRREDRRRTASITVATGKTDPRRVRKELAPLFGRLELPPGYSVEFDPDAIKQAEALSGTVFSLLLTLGFCYMVIASVNESFIVPLAVLASVPPSLAVPALFLAIIGIPFNPETACAFVTVSGMTVNASVLCAAGMDCAFQKRHGEKSMSLYRVLRQKMPALLATAGTTIAGAMPFLFLREGANSLVRTLSLVSALGVAASCFFAISAVPAFSLIMRNFLKHVSHKNFFRLCGTKKSLTGYEL